jgi:hypothetical protein
MTDCRLSVHAEIRTQSEFSIAQNEAANCLPAISSIVDGRNRSYLPFGSFFAWGMPLLVPVDCLFLTTISLSFAAAESRSLSVFRNRPVITPGNRHLQRNYC